MSKKILMLTFEFPPFRGGIGRYAAQLALGAHRCGCSVTVAAPDFKSRGAMKDAEDFPFEVRRFKGTIYSAAQFPAMVQRIRRLVSSDHYDIIHAIDWPNSLALTLLNRFFKIPFITTVYGTEILGVAGSRHVRYLSGGKLFSGPQELLAISQFTRSLLLSKHPEVDESKVRVTPLGVDARFFERPPDDISVRTKFGIAEDHKVILTVSRLDERKGHRVVLHSLAQLPEHLRSELVYVIAGPAQDNAYVEELHRFAEKLDVPVVFTGAVSDDELRSLYANAFLFCMPGEPHPTRVEGFGLAYLEAAAQGVASIASSIGAIPEIVLHNQTGILVEPMNVESLTDALAQLLSDPKRTQHLGKTARKRAESYTWEKCARETYRLQSV